MTIKTWHLKQSYIDQLNLAGTENGPQSWGNPAWKGQIKGIQFSFESSDLPDLTSPYNTKTSTLTSVESYIEFLDGSKCNFDFFKVNTLSSSPLQEIKMYDGNLILPIRFDPNRLSYDMVRNSPYDAVSFMSNGNGQLDIYIELTSLSGSNNWMEVILPLESLAGVYEGALVLLPAAESNNGGGGSSTPELASHDGKVVGTVANNPTQVEVTFNGQPLPEGSVVKFGSQKFLKVSGGSMEFVAIEVMPKSEWGWDSSADADWAILQNM